MTYRDIAARLLKKHEGCRYEPYLCRSGKWTWGYGRNVDNNPLDIDETVFVLAHIGEPAAIAEYLLNRDIVRVVDHLRIMSWWNTLNDNRKAALIDIVYNIGFGSFLQFKKTIYALAAGDFERAAAEVLDSLWSRQVGKRSSTIAHIIRTGELP